MVMKNLTIALILTSISIACDSKQATHGEQTEEAVSEEVVAMTTSGITLADSAFVNGLINQLQGIEKFGVGQSFEMLASLLAHKGDSATYQKVYDILKKKDEYVQLFTISEVDTRNGYMVYAPNYAEVTYTQVYWNMKDGSQLLATEAWGCGPVCDSSIEFMRYTDGGYTRLDLTDVIPDIGKLPKMLIPEYDPDDSKADPIEFKYVLPKKGKNIRFCVDEQCIELEWNEGTFAVRK
jgi:hypothetical protein